MTKAELMQLRSLNSEITMLKKQLKEIEETQDELYHETVRGSQREFPYLLHSIAVTSIADPQAAESRKEKIKGTKALIAQKIEQCDIEYRRLIRYINSIPDSLIRQIMTYRYINAYNWIQIARHIGGNNTPDSVRMAHNRFLAAEQSA